MATNWTLAGKGDRGGNAPSAGGADARCRLPDALLTVLLALVTVSTLQAQTKRPTVTFTRGSGGSIQTKLMANIAVNKDSTLEREWITAHDAALPADIRETVGVTTVYERDRSSSGDYRYKASFKVHASEPLTAIQVRFLTFDIWGNHVRNLEFHEIADITAGEDTSLSGTWSVYSENEVSEHYASIGYISRVRTKDGRVVEADTTSIVEEAKKFTRKFTAADLEPPKAEKK